MEDSNIDRERLLTEFEMANECFLDEKYDKALIGVDTEWDFAVYDRGTLLDLLKNEFDDELAEKLVAVSENENHIVIQPSGIEDGMIVLEPRDKLDQAVKWKTEDGRAVYDYDLLIEGFMKDGMTHDEAVEWYGYNTVRSLPYVPSHPLIIHTII